MYASIVRRNHTSLGISPEDLEGLHDAFSIRSPQLAAAIAGGFKDWADAREDKLVNLAPGFGRISALRGPRGGFGSPGNGPGSKKNAGCTSNQPRRPILGPTAKRQKDK